MRRVAPFIRMAWSRELQERDAFCILSSKHDSLSLAEHFEHALAEEQSKAEGRSEMTVQGRVRSKESPGSVLQLGTTRALVRLWWPTLLAQMGWASIETASR